MIKVLLKIRFQLDLIKYDLIRKRKKVICHYEHLIYVRVFIIYTIYFKNTYVKSKTSYT